MKLNKLDISPEIIGKVYKPSLSVVSDVNEFLNDLNEKVIAEKNINRKNVLQEANKQYIEFATPKQSSYKTEGYADLKKVIQDLKENLPDDAIITSDAGNFFYWIARYYKYVENEFYLGATYGAMGYGIPSALA